MSAWFGLLALPFVIAVGRGTLALVRTRGLPAVAGTTRCPRVSVVVPACNEEAGLGRAVRALLAQDLPELRVVLIDDRSTDGTPGLVDVLAADARVLGLHVEELPSGWLGKVHALHLAVEHLSADVRDDDLWLFTDADVVLAPDALRRAVTLVEAERFDLLAVLPRFTSRGGGWLGVAGMLGAILSATAGPAVEDRQRPDGPFVGVGAFNLVRARTFLATPGFAWLRLEVVDDLGLGLMVRRAGGRLGLRLGADCVEVEWYPSLAAMMRGLEKNLFLGTVGGSVPLALVLVGWLTLVAAGAPLAAVLAGSGAPAAMGACAAVWLGWVLVAGRRLRLPTWAVALQPLAQVVVLVMIVRSTLVVLRDGGVTWRGTFYPLGELRAGKRFRVTAG